MESSRIPFLEELALFLKGIVTPRIDFVGESSDLSAQRIQFNKGMEPTAQKTRRGSCPGR